MVIILKKNLVLSTRLINQIFVSLPHGRNAKVSLETTKPLIIFKIKILQDLSLWQPPHPGILRRWTLTTPPHPL